VLQAPEYGAEKAIPAHWPVSVTVRLEMIIGRWRRGRRGGTAADREVRSLARYLVDQQ
jgi:hypothetical protein